VRDRDRAPPEAVSGRRHEERGRTGSVHGRGLAGRVRVRGASRGRARADRARERFEPARMNRPNRVTRGAGVARARVAPSAPRAQLGREWLPSLRWGHAASGGARARVRGSSRGRRTTVIAPQAGHRRTSRPVNWRSMPCLRQRGIGMPDRGADGPSGTPCGTPFKRGHGPLEGRGVAWRQQAVVADFDEAHELIVLSVLSDPPCLVALQGLLAGTFGHVAATRPGP